MASPVVLILGAGSNVGQHVARAFAAKNYKVALVARKLKEEESTPNELHIPGDLSNPNTVVDAFAKVRAVFGHPSVVVYNGINPYGFFFYVNSSPIQKLLLLRPATPRAHSLCL
jgi:NAD(P)-dependent dehydrogenase (short-subunit alcohol dehydrogenase family)